MANLESISDISYELGEYTLHGLTKGKDSSSVILCLHGWLDNAASFIPLMNEIDDHYIVAVDWPGHGLSSHRGIDAHYHFIDYVYDLLVLFECTQWKTVHIVAHSMGGMIASAFAAAFPEKVNSLTLIDSIGFISSKSEQTTMQLRSGMLSRLKQKDKRKPLHPSIDSAISARQAVSDLTHKNAQLIVERGCLKVGNNFTWCSDSRLRNISPYRLTFSQAKQFIKDIQAPVQLIYGDKGIELVTIGLMDYAPLFNNLLVFKLSGGHHIHMEQASKTAEYVTSFIEKMNLD